MILAAAALLIIASPIRFGAAVSFGKSKRASGRFWVSYIHPALFLYEYSSKEHRERVRVVGIDPKWFRWRKRKDAAGQNNTGTTATARNERTIDNNYSINDINIDNSIDENDDTIMAKMLRRAEKIKDDPLYTKTIEGLNDFRKSGFYRYFKNRSFRRKFFKWLKRAWNCAVTIVHFDMLKLHAAAGLANPADVGRMYGYFIAAKNALALRNKTVSIEVEPVFTEKRLDADIEFAGRTSVAIVISNTLTAALTFPYLQFRRLAKSKQAA